MKKHEKNLDDLRPVNYGTVGTYKDAETVIVDGVGWRHDGYYCNCMACPYVVFDITGCGACYGDMYHECRNHD